MLLFLVFHHTHFKKNVSVRVFERSRELFRKRTQHQQMNAWSFCLDVEGNQELFRGYTQRGQLRGLGLGL
jgi:hypothetical protein